MLVDVSPVYPNKVQNRLLVNGLVDRDDRAKTMSWFMFGLVTWDPERNARVVSVPANTEVCRDGVRYVTKRDLDFVIGETATTRTVPCTADADGGGGVCTQASLRVNESDLAIK